jgi:hypothetical protein
MRTCEYFLSLSAEHPRRQWPTAIAILATLKKQAVRFADQIGCNDRLDVFLKKLLHF